MNSEELPPVSESPWFWVLIFSLMGLLALAAIHGKYGQRQAGLERQYQARERTAEQVAATSDRATADESSQATANGSVPVPEYALPGHNLISIWPLAVLLAVVSAAAGVMLSRERKKMAAPREG